MIQLFTPPDLSQTISKSTQHHTSYNRDVPGPLHVTKNKNIYGHGTNFVRVYPTDGVVVTLCTSHRDAVVSHFGLLCWANAPRFSPTRWTLWDSLHGRCESHSGSTSLWCCAGEFIIELVGDSLPWQREGGKIFEPWQGASTTHSVPGNDKLSGTMMTRRSN